MKKYITLSIILLVLAVAGGILITKSHPSTSGNEVGVESENIIAASTPLPTPDPNSPLKEFNVDGSNYSFNPSTIAVNKGDTVRITFRDNDGQHNLVVNDYNVSTKVVGEGATDTIQFVADKTGTFEYFCSVGSHRDLGMTGQLIVK